ncbi:hypothetical protein N7501_005858 [Penicillium viridicatum]|nr:hypothetical protein N7501_005858 [Penicillium viridicatum]
MGSWSLLRGLALHLSLLCLVVPISAASTCYYPNGDISTDTPCFPDGDVSHCCASSSICLKNKLCLSLKKPYHLSRGSCTDQDWRSGNCPNICKDAQQGAGAAIVPLNTTGSESTFCCNSLFVNSTSDEMICGYVKGSPQQPLTTIVDGAAIPGVAALSNLVKDSNDTSSVVSNDANTTTRSGPYITGNDSKDVAIGAGVGVPLGVIALISIGWALWERRKRKRLSFPPVQPVQSLQPYQPVITNDRNLGVPELGTYTPKPVELYQTAPRA